MRVRAVAPGAAAVCAVALAGCGASDDGTRTVTVTTEAVVSVPGSASEPTVTRPAATTTTTTTRTRTATRPSPPARTVSVPTTVTTSAPRTTTRGRSEPPDRRGADEFEPDPIGGTVPARGRVLGTGYTVQVPTGWNDGARRFEGSGVRFDLVYVKGRGSGVTSNILIVRIPDSRAAGRDAEDLRKVLRRRVEASSGGADVEAGPRVEVDGETGLTFLTRRRVGGTSVLQRQVAVVRDGAVFTVGLNAVRETADDDERVFAAFLRSWRWR